MFTHIIHDFRLEFAKKKRRVKKQRLLADFDIHALSVLFLNCTKDSTACSLLYNYLPSQSRSLNVRCVYGKDLRLLLLPTNQNNRYNQSFVYTQFTFQQGTCLLTQFEIFLGSIWCEWNLLYKSKKIWKWRLSL